MSVVTGCSCRCHYDEGVMHVIPCCAGSDGPAGDWDYYAPAAVEEPVSTVTINGKSYTGKSVTMRNGVVMVDGKLVEPGPGSVSITVNGNIDRLGVDTCDSVTITGDVGSVVTVSGDVSVTGLVGKGIQTTSGDVEVTGSVSGNVTTLSGDVSSAGGIHGSVQTVSGDIRGKRV